MKGLKIIRYQEQIKEGVFDEDKIVSISSEKVYYTEREKIEDNIEHIKYLPQYWKDKFYNNLPFRLVKLIECDNFLTIKRLKSRLGINYESLKN